MDFNIKKPTHIFALLALIVAFLVIVVLPILIFFGMFSSIESIQIGEMSESVRLTFEIVALLDKSVKLAPDNMKIRLANGKSSVVMPFFVNRMSRGIKDLTAVIESNALSSIKAEARFWLGYAYQKKATTEWIK